MLLLGEQFVSVSVITGISSRALGGTDFDNQPAFQLAIAVLSIA